MYPVRRINKEKLKKRIGMKIKNIIVVLLIGMVGLSTSCNKDELESLRSENKKLEQKIEEKDSTIQELTKLYDQVERKIQLIIKQKEGAKLRFDDVSHGKARKNLKDISQAIQKNQRKIKSLTNDLQAMRYKASQHKKQLEETKAKMARQSDSLNALSKEIKSKQIRIKGLLADLDKKDSTITMLNNQVHAYKDSVRAKEKTIHTAYVAAMPEKKLANKGVIKKTGGFLGFLGQTYVVDPQFNESDFITFHTAEQTSLPINAPEKDIELVTRHSGNSYTLIAGDAGKTVLKITDKERFWRTGKRLVIMY
jgi:predicted  nucleic acid-binding Zn-ribbon protein